MVKLIKVILCLGLLLVVLLLGAGVYLSRNLPEIVKEAVETHGSEATGTTVSFGGMQVNYVLARITLNELLIGNPPQFTTPYAFRLSELTLQVNIPSLLKDAIVIDEFTISGAHINAEQVGDSLQTNLQVISNNANRSGNRSESSAGQAESSADSELASSVRLIVKEFKFTGNSLDLVTQHWGDRQIVVPDLILKNIGEKEGGLTPDELSQRVISLVTKQAGDAAKMELKNVAKEKAKKKITEKIGDALNNLFSR